MTFWHLANMTSGYALPEPPGQAWSYNDPAISLYLKLLFDGVFRQAPNAAAMAPHRLGALQFQDGAIFGSRQGYGLRTTPRDFARIGWLWLNKGEWNGTPLLPRHYFDRYMRPQVSYHIPRTLGGAHDYLRTHFFGGGTDQTPYGPGIYGFNWWFNVPVGPGRPLTWPDAPTDTFQANGHWDRKILVGIPSLGMVAVARGKWGDFELGAANAAMNQHLKLLVQAVSDPGPLPGQIVVDPRSPRWLVYNRDADEDGRLDPFFLAGPGDPEDFLYRGRRRANGTRDGDQMRLIDKLRRTGANSIYLQAIRSHGGDGDATHNPFHQGNPTAGIDMAVLEQWETWFRAMDQHGIVIFFFFYDDAIRVSQRLNWRLDRDGNLHPHELRFIETLVNRFEHHRHVIWAVMEEVEEMGPDYVAHAKKIAAAIRRADDHDHIIAVHKRSGVTFSEFADDPSIEQFAMQTAAMTAGALHQTAVAAWRHAAGRYNVNIAETPGVQGQHHGHGRAARLQNWAVALGGAYVMAIGWDIAHTPARTLEDAGRLVRFMEATRFHEMAPHDALGFAGTEYVLAQPGARYIAYASALSGDIGPRDMTAGIYRFLWFDIPTGATVVQEAVDVAAGDQRWRKPDAIGEELAVYITRAGGG